MFLEAQRKSFTFLLFFPSILLMFLVRKRANGEQGNAGRIRAGQRPERPGWPRRPGPGPATALGLCSAVARGTIIPASVINSRHKFMGRLKKQKKQVFQVLLLIWLRSFALIWFCHRFDQRFCGLLCFIAAESATSDWEILTEV